MAEKKAPNGGHSNIALEDILNTITDQLHIGLSTLKEQLGEKKFEKRIKKAAKLLVAGIEKKQAKNSEKKQVAPAKKTVAPAKKSIKIKKAAKNV